MQKDNRKPAISLTFRPHLTTMNAAPTPVFGRQRPEEPMSSSAPEVKVVSVPESDPFMMSVTDAAVAKVKDFAAKMPEAKGKALRVFIQGGGCSGFQYGFTFDDAKPNDYVLKAKDVTVVVDKTSAQKLHGSTVDWIEDFRGAGFAVENPNASSSCGCGKSFS